MNPALRKAILRGTLAAQKFHRQHDLEKKLSSGQEPVDVFSLIEDENVRLAFKKLDKLFGAYLPIAKNSEGILINSEHPLYTQRYTAAHELGHHVMRHQSSLDTNILERSPIFDDSSNPSNDNMQEREADTFASELLMPKWLIISHLSHMGLSYTDLQNVEVIYQLSLRIGVSFSAMCWGLVTQKILNYNLVKKMVSITPKEIKKRLIAADILDQNPWGNVWIIYETPAAYRIIGSPGDFFIFQMKEHPSGGYIWDFSALKELGFSIFDETTLMPNDATVGGTVIKKIVATQKDAIHKKIEFSERRPWNNEILNQLQLLLDLTGRQKGFYNKVILSA